MDDGWDPAGVLKGGSSQCILALALAWIGARLDRIKGISYHHIACIRLFAFSFEVWVARVGWSVFFGSDIVQISGGEGLLSRFNWSLSFQKGRWVRLSLVHA